MNNPMKLGFYLSVFFSATLSNLFAQSAMESKKSVYVSSGQYLTNASLKDKHPYADSLTGFNAAEIINRLNASQVYDQEYADYLKFSKRNFIKTKYNLWQANAAQFPANTSKLLGNNSQVNVAPCVNEGFESTAAGTYSTAASVSGWTLSSQTMSGCSVPAWSSGSPEFSIVSTPVSSVAAIGTLSHSPLGGTKVAWLNNTTAGSYLRSKLSTTFPVTSSNNLFNYAFAGVYQYAGHLCCEEAGFAVRLLNCNGQEIVCQSMTVSPGCLNSGITFSTVAQALYTNWQVKSIDLSPFIGSCVTVEVWSFDCLYGGHYGSTFFDASCGNQFLQGSGLSNITPAPVNPVTFCPGTTTATINGPPGYSSYSWIAPVNAPGLSPAQASLSSITVPVSTLNAVHVYTVLLSNPNNCMFMATYTVSSSNPSQVGILAYGSSPTCLQGSSGSASVQTSGSNIGYTYTWLGPQNYSVTGTSSVNSGLSAGIYTVTASAPNNSACGVSSITLSVGSSTFAPTQLTKKYCNNTAYFSAGSGSNFQWYSNLTPISGTVGTSASFTLNNANQVNVVRLGRNFQGCRDSIIYLLQATPGSTISHNVSGSGCHGSNNGSAVISLTPVAQTIPPNTNYTLSSTGSAPSFNQSSLGISANSFTASNLPVGQTLSLSIFDGSCYTGSLITINPIVPAFNFSVSAPQNYVCQGNNAQASVALIGNAQAGQYTYSWSPSALLSPGASTLQQIVVTPTASAGNTSSYNFTVIVTPTAANCPVTKTVTISAANPLTPSINPVAAFCNSAPQQTISANPPGGTFTGANAFVSANGIITPSLTSPGVNTFTYTNSLYNCMASSSATFFVHPSPAITIIGNTLVCPGDLTVLNAGGAHTYSWVNGPNTPAYVISPTVSTVYTVSGGDSTSLCVSHKTVAVSVKPAPLLQVSGQDSICSGNSATLNVSGASSYTWSNGSTLITQVFTPSTTIQFTITGKDSLSGCSGHYIGAIVVLSCLHLNALNGILPVKIYPNPATDKVYVESEGSLQLQVIDELGRILKNETIAAGISELSLTKFAPGVYVLQCSNGQQTKTIRLIKTVER